MSKTSVTIELGERASWRVQQLISGQGEQIYNYLEGGGTSELYWKTFPLNYQERLIQSVSSMASWGRGREGEEGREKVSCDG